VAVAVEAAAVESEMTGGRGAHDPNELPILSPAAQRSAKIIALFLSQVPLELALLDAAIASEDLGEVRRVAHKLKGSSRAVGVMRMAAVCEKLERSSGHAIGAAPERSRLVAEYERARVLLEAEQKTAPR